MSDNVIQFPTKTVETLPPQMEGLYEVLSETIARLQALGHDSVLASLDGYLVSIGRIVHDSADPQDVTQR